MPEVVQFAEIIGLSGPGRHVGCVMAAGPDWIEVSIPRGIEPGAELKIRLPPSKYHYRVVAAWHSIDMLGLVYVDEIPGSDEIAAALVVNVPASHRGK